MIKNVVFDFGRVIVNYDPAYMVGRYVSDPKDAKLLAEVVFDRLYWDKLDDGSITDEEIIENSKARLPERLWDIAHTIYYNWIYNLPEIEGMPELVSRIKEEYGAPVFLLSNVSTYFSDRADEFDVLKRFDKCIFSAACGRVKPNRDMYEYLCEECGIIPEETLFVDDNAANIQGANEFGIHGYLFDGDVRRLSEYIDTLFLK